VPICSCIQDQEKIFPDPGFRILDPGSQTHIFDRLMKSFWVKSTIILSVLAKKIFSTGTCSSIKLFVILWYLWLQKNGRTKKLFSKIRIRDKHPRSAALSVSHHNLCRSENVELRSRKDDL
jgi:hypothetical protein